jgi:hypothetical protein
MSSALPWGGPPMSISAHRRSPGVRAPARRSPRRSRSDHGHPGAPLIRRAPACGSVRRRRRSSRPRIIVTRRLHVVSHASLELLAIAHSSRSAASCSSRWRASASGEELGDRLTLFWPAYFGADLGGSTATPCPKFARPRPGRRSGRREVGDDVAEVRQHHHVVLLGAGRAAARCRRCARRTRCPMLGATAASQPEPVGEP